MFKKIFSTSLEWPVNATAINVKTHSLNFASASDLTVSADAAFKGDGSKHNPEDLFLSALVSCHFMSYQYLCNANQISIVSYTDTIKGDLLVNTDGSGAFTSISLHPIVSILKPVNLSLAKQLHAKAHQLCFIANSTSVPIEIHPKITIKS